MYLRSDLVEILRLLADLGRGLCHVTPQSLGPEHWQPCFGPLGGLWPQSQPRLGATWKFQNLGCLWHLPENFQPRPIFQELPFPGSEIFPAPLGWRGQA